MFSWVFTHMYYLVISSYLFVKYHLIILMSIYTCIIQLSVPTFKLKISFTRKAMISIKYTSKNWRTRTRRILILPQNPFAFWQILYYKCIIFPCYDIFSSTWEAQYQHFCILYLFHIFCKCCFHYSQQSFWLVYFKNPQSIAHKV